MTASDKFSLFYLNRIAQTSELLDRFPWIVSLLVMVSAERGTKQRGYARTILGRDVSIKIRDSNPEPRHRTKSNGY